MLCRAHVAQLRAHADEITEAGAHLAAVGTGDLAYAEWFAAEQDVRFPLLVDDELVSYQVVGARRGRLIQLLDRTTVTAMLRAFRSGHRQGGAGRHPLLFGATHVICPDGRVPFAWRNTGYGDTPDIPQILHAVKEPA